MSEEIEDTTENEVTFWRPVVWKFNFNMIYQYIKLLYQLADESFEIYCQKINNDHVVYFYMVTTFGKPVVYILQTFAEEAKLDNKQKDPLQIKIPAAELYNLMYKIKQMNKKVSDFDITFKWSKDHVKVVAHNPKGKRYGLSVFCESLYKKPEVDPTNFEFHLKTKVEFKRLQTLREVIEVADKMTISTAYFPTESNQKGPEVLLLKTLGHHSGNIIHGYSTIKLNYKETSNKLKNITDYKIYPMNFMNTLLFEPENPGSCEVEVNFTKDKFVAFVLSYSPNEKFYAFHNSTERETIDVESENLPIIA